MNRPEDRHEILARVSIGALLEQLVGRPRNRSFRCPSDQHAQTGRTPPVSVDEAQGLWCCHGCGAGGSAVDALVLARNFTVAEAFTYLREASGLERRPEPQSAKPPAVEAAPPDDAATVLATFTKARGWSPDVVGRFGLHVVTDGYGQPRVRFPFRSEGVTLWHQDRAVGRSTRKYLAPPGMPQRAYAMDLAGAVGSAQEGGVCWLVEGPPDVIALGHLADIDRWPAVIGTPGTNYSGLPRLANALAGCTVPVVADADQAGETMRTNAAHLLTQAGAHVVQVRLPDGVNDLDDLRRSLDCNDAAFTDALAEAYEAGLAEHRAVA